MKQEISKPTEIETEDDEMLPEYDFSKMAGGVRGKYYQAYRAGHTIKIHRTDGTTTVQHFTPENGTIMLDPDVQPYFPDSEAVNKALRALIALIPQKQSKVKKRKKVAAEVAV